MSYEEYEEVTEFCTKENKDMEIDKALTEALEAMENYDVVDNPKHYCSGAHECIDVMEQVFGTSAVIDFCRCNIFKYRFRASQKNGEEDIKKAEWYETKLMELNEKKKGNAALYI